MLKEHKSEMIGMSADAIQKLKETISIDASIARENDIFLSKNCGCGNWFRIKIMLKKQKRYGFLNKI
ncbi:hypothetical protein ACT7DC_13745 [Bacillus cereus]